MKLMDIYTAHDLPYIRETLKDRLLRGEVGILPTDTIYGVSGNALDAGAVERINRVKGKETPSSFIPHSLDWARLVVDEDQHALFDESLGEYFGPYTTFWRYSSKWTELPEALCSSGLVGLRFPGHWITDFAKEMRVPLVTTSVNRHKEPHMTCLDDLPDSVRDAVDFIVYEGPLPGPPSTLVHCYEGLPFKMVQR